MKLMLFCFLVSLLIADMEAESNKDYPFYLIFEILNIIDGVFAL